MQLLDPPKGPRMLIAREQVSNCSSVFSEKLDRATQKRKNEHNSGRLLLEKCVVKWGLPLDYLEVNRTSERAPYLSWVQGSWRNNPLPGISISHSGKWAYCALIEEGWWIGIDAESKDRVIQKNALDMFAKNEELEWIKENPEQSIRIWTAKEAIQKVERMGMNLNPRNIEILDYNVNTFEHEDMVISIAWKLAGDNPKKHEDELLELTRKAMQENPNFTIGCKTTRNSL